MSLPEWMFEGDSGRPTEPVTAGLPVGPGPGPEVLSTNTDPDAWIEEDLSALAAFGSADAAELLREMRQTPAPTDEPPPDTEMI